MSIDYQPPGFEQPDRTAPDPRSLGVDPADISVAVMYPGNRVDKVAVPLRASQMDVEIDPAEPYARDIVLADNADRDLGREVLKKPLHDAKLIYRMRGDVFRELDLWPMHPVKKWGAKNVVLPNVDGVIAVTDLLAQKYDEQTNVTPTGSAGLAKRVDDWPDVQHQDEELRIVTLTNVNYMRKIQPLIEWAPVVDEILDELGGRWHICGDGEHEATLESEFSTLENVSFEGYVDGEEELAASNLMIHASWLDGQPNAILEGLASGLPVITNPWPEFLNFGWPLDIVTDRHGLRDRLERYTTPDVRDARGREGTQYINEFHSPEAVGRDYERYFAEVLSDA